jgi:hypothetical protein
MRAGDGDLAERVGFEPTYTGEDVTGIPVQRLRPLGHLSGAFKLKSGRAIYRPAARQANPIPADWIASMTGPWNCFDSGTSGSRMPS